MNPRNEPQNNQQSQEPLTPQETHKKELTEHHSENSTLYGTFFKLLAFIGIFCIIGVVIYCIFNVPTLPSKIFTEP